MKQEKTEHGSSAQPVVKPAHISDTDSHRLPEVRASRGTDPRQVRSAAALRQALLDLLTEKAFDQITVREICARAGVHNATFFRHHADKEALLNHVAQDEIDRLVAISFAHGYSHKGFLALCDYVAARRILWRALLTGGAGGAMREELMQLSMALAAEYSDYPTWLPQELSVICSTTLIVETLSWWLKQDEGEYSSEAVADIMHELVESAVIAPRRPRAGD